MAAQKKKQDQGDRLVSKNRRATFDYTLGETIEAGLVLMGSEVRALREGPANLIEAWVELDRRGEAWVKGMRIATLKHAAFAHEEIRTRKLLLHEAQIERLREGVHREGMTIVVTKCYFKNNRAKIEISLARGKKDYDKRQTLREKDGLKEARAAMQRGRERMNVPLSITRGGQAAIVENQGDFVVVRSSMASPPGSTLSMKHGELPVLVKVRGCKRLEESPLPYRIEGRLVSFTRAARDALFGQTPAD